VDVVYSILMRKQAEIIRVQKEIEQLKDWIRRQEAKDTQVQTFTADALARHAQEETQEVARRAQEEIQALEQQIEDRACKTDRGAKGSSLLGVFLCGCLLTAAILLAIWTHDSDPAEESAVRGGGAQVVVSLEQYPPPQTRQDSRALRVSAVPQHSDRELAAVKKGKP
jgi:hypothetical protein